MPFWKVIRVLRYYGNKYIEKLIMLIKVSCIVDHKPLHPKLSPFLS